MRIAAGTIKKARDGNDLRRQKPFGVAVQLLSIPAQKKRERVETIGGPIRHYGPGKEGDPMLPSENDGRNIVPLSGDPIRKAVAEEEERA